MRDPITDAAQDPSCLLCLTPDRGGSWWSRLRPAQLRNFAADPMTCTDAKTALDKIDQSHDFTFEIEFKCVETNAVYVFASDASRDFIRVFMSAGQVIVNSALMSTSPGGSTQFSAGSDSTNRHALTVKMIKNTIAALIDGEIVYTRENLVRNAIEISAPRSNAGYVYKISITDDTTGEIVWQAAYSDLYDTSNPWPSPVPRNFAEEPEAWRGLMAVIAAATETDWSFKIRYNLNSADGSQRIFSPGNNTGPIAVFWSSEGILYLRTIGGNGTIIQANPAGDPTGTHTVEIIAASGLYSIIYDGKTVHSVQDTPTLPRSSAEEVIQSGMNGTILYAEFSCGKAVWRYPTEAERVRLITKTNVRTDRGAFEAADETQPARVDTALDLRGKVSSYTVVVDFEAAEFPETTTMECHQELAGQGGALIGSGTPPICSIGYYLTSSGSARLQLSQEVAGGRHVVNATLTGRLSGRHICCGVVEVDPAAPLTASTLYLDGVRIGNASIYAVPTGNAAVNARCFSIAGHSFTGGWPPYTGKVYSCLLFDRALSAAEIAALTPKQA